MLTRRTLLILAATLCALLPLPGWAQTAYNTVVVFGDSLSDTGNIANLTASQFKVRYPAYNAVLGFDYTDGRFTDGTDTQPAASTAYKGVWVEQMAAALGSGVTVKNSLDGGTNYAYGDATTGSGTTTDTETFGPTSVSLTLPNMGQQVTLYLATNPTPSATTLYVLWGGANDLLNAAKAGQDPVAAAKTAAANELGLVQQLMNKGATNFMLPNLPPLGAFAAAYGPTAVTALNTASGVFAQALTTGLTQLKQGAMGSPLTLYQPDVLTLFSTLAAAPMTFGIGNITTAADTVTVSPDTYLIWDGLHPTTTGHHFVAATAANLVTPLVASTVTLTAPAAIVAGQSESVTAVVKSAKSGVVPSGLVTIFSGAAVVGSGALDATGTMKATFTPAGAGGSSVSLTAVYAGDTTDSQSASSAQTTALLSAVVGTTTAVTSSSASANLGASVTFTATVTPASSTYGAPSGTVTFLDGTTTLGTGTLSAGVATYATTSLAAGTHTITAMYGAAGVFGGSTSAALTETVTAPGFTASANPTSLTITSGGSGTVTLMVTTAGGYTGTVTPTCGTLPAHFSCTFTASASNIAGSSTLTIATNAATATALAEPGVGPGGSAARVWMASLLLPGTLGLFGMGLRRRRRSVASVLGMALAVLVGVAAMGLSGCGSSSNNNAAKGSYTVPVIFTAAASGGTTPAAQTVNIAVTVQ